MTAGKDLRPCSCGGPHPHEVAWRPTLDGVHIHLWSDGPVTGAMGVGLQGIPIVRPRTPEAQHQALVAGRLLLGEVCIYDLSDLPTVYAAARKAAAKDGLPGTMRDEMRRAAGRQPPMRLDWRVLCTDRDGRPRERFAYLPRLRWPGRGVWDFCGGPGSSGGRYVLAHRIHKGRRFADETWDTSTGLRFRTLAELWAHLSTEGW